MNTQLTVFDSHTPEGIKIVSKNGKLITSSLNVAHVFGKDHSKVLRDIENLKCSLEFRESNFGLSYYTNKLSNVPEKQYKKYEMTRDGFTFLVMGYTGEKAGKFKEDYIGLFNKMEAELLKQQTIQIPETHHGVLRLLAKTANQLADSVEENQKLTSKIKEDQPKVEFVEHILESKDSMEVGQFAKILCKKGYETGQNRLFKLMQNELGLLIHSKKPRQYAMDNKWLELRPTTYTNAYGEKKTDVKVVITGKGQLYIEKKFRELFREPAA